MPPKSGVRMGLVVRTVWVESWQMQCCGTPFRIGERISWTLARVQDDLFLEDLLGVDRASTITDCEDHHDVAPNPDESPTEGEVRTISAVFCDYRPDPARPGPGLFPVAGTGDVQARDSVDGWEPETEVRKLIGYLVEVAVPIT